MGGLVPFGGGGFRTTQGSAHWLPPEVAKATGLYGGDGLLFARGSQGMLRYPLKKSGGSIGEGHAIVCAPSRSGKGIGFVIPNLLTFKGSVFVIDPKGENAHFTAERRRHFGPVYVVDPCGISGQPRASFNPLEWMRGSFEFDEDLRLIVEALTPETGGTERFWNQGARDLLFGVLCYLIATPGERISLGRAYQIFNGSEKEWEAVLKQMARCDGGSAKLNAKVRDKANWYSSLHEEHKQYHRGSVQFHLTWLGVDSAREMLEHSSFDIRELKSSVATVYVCIPPLSLSVFEGFSRLLTTLSIKAVMARLARESDPPILFMLDEFATTVGKMNAFDDAFTVISGYGGRFALILQTIDQLQSLYPERRGGQSWKTVVENSGLQLYFNARKGTAQYVSETLGMTTVTEISPVGGSKQSQRPLLYANEVSHPLDVQGNHVADAVFAFVEGLPPVRARRLVSWRDPEFKPLHDPSSSMPEYIDVGQSEWEQAQSKSGAGLPEDKYRSSLPEPPKMSKSDVDALQRVSAWEDPSSWA